MLEMSKKCRSEKCLQCSVKLVEGLNSRHSSTSNSWGLDGFSKTKFKYKIYFVWHVLEKYSPVEAPVIV